MLRPMIWMLLISLLLFWLPVLGPLIGGFVGGRKADGLGSAILAALLPAVIVGVIFFFLGGCLVGLPVMGAIAGAGGAVLVLVNSGPLLVGAIIGGLFGGRD